MGNMCCGAGNSEMLQRQELLKEGSEFKKKTTYLGVLSKTEHIYLQLNPTATRLAPLASMLFFFAAMATHHWLEPRRRGPDPSRRKSALEMVIFGSNGQKLLELTADAMSVRDLWVQTLDELCFSVQSKATEEDSKALQQELAKQEQRQKDKYWKDRASELEQRKMDAEERKKKIGLTGMKYTAQAMANR
uniref:PH domain-containing protein n=1 Tax=Globisporangium ultimum (strain ATCC 200006 / CBS 805.95 / DAOM BR144) TaxID=431595 RepID=K3WUB6_GLOUD